MRTVEVLEEFAGGVEGLGAGKGDSADSLMIYIWPENSAAMIDYADAAVHL